MPDRSDVEQALASLIAGVIYPDGADRDGVAGCTCRVYRGWPIAGALEEDIARGAAHVTVQPIAGTMRDRTRYSPEWQGTLATPTLSTSVHGETVAFDGYGGAGQVAGIRVDGQGFAYRMRDGDSASLVAAALAVQIRAARSAVSSNRTVHLPGGRGILARVVADGDGGQEVRRQECRFRLTFWCPDPTLRDSLVGLVDAALADLTFLDVGDWACRLRIAGDSSSDEGSAAGIWRRDLMYSVEYPTIIKQTLPSMLFGLADVNSTRFVS